jgi:DNA-directed RNA polymerase beta' subunit
VRKTIGCSSDCQQIGNLIKEGELFIKRYLGQLSLDFLLGDDDRYFQSIFEGNKFEGHTMIPVIEAFKNRYYIDRLIVVADAGLMSNKNIKQLLENGYFFIIGARIKNKTQAIQEQILSLHLADQQSVVLSKDATQRIIISYSNNRAKNDSYNRQKGMERLKKLLAKGKLTKEHINNKGYNKYLKPEGEIKIIIGEGKYQDDAKWDGLKGYTTNTDLPKETILEYYKQ